MKTDHPHLFRHMTLLLESFHKRKQWMPERQLGTLVQAAVAAGLEYAGGHESVSIYSDLGGAA